MALLASNNASSSSQSQLADAWDSFRMAVPAAIRDTTEQLKNLARVSTQSAIHDGAAFVSGPTGAVMSATIAELAGHAIESRVYELTTPLGDPSLSHSIRDRLRLEIHNQASNVFGQETSSLRTSAEPDLRNSSAPKDQTLSRLEDQKEPSPFDRLLSPQRRWEKEIGDKRRDETRKDSHQIVPRRLKLF